MSVTLRIAALDGSVEELTAERSWRIADVKAELEEVTGVLQREQRLISGLAELKDDVELASLAADLAPDSVVELSFLRRPSEQAFWLEEVSSDGRRLKDAPPDIRADPEVVLAAAKNNCSAFRNASEELRADPEVVLSAIRENGNVFRYASPALQVDLNFILKAVRCNACSLACASDALRSDREFILQAVRENPDVLRFVAVGFRADRGLVLAAVERQGGALQHAHGRLRADREVVEAAVRQDGLALRFAMPELKVDRGIVLAAVSQSPMAFQYAAEELRSDREVARMAVKLDGRAAKYAAAELQSEFRIFSMVMDLRHPPQQTGEEAAAGPPPRSGGREGTDAGAGVAESGAGPGREGASLDPAAFDAVRKRLVAGQRITHVGPRPLFGRPINRMQQQAAAASRSQHRAEAENESDRGGVASSGPSVVRAVDPDTAVGRLGAGPYPQKNPASLLDRLSAGADIGTKRPRLLLPHTPLLTPELVKTGLEAAARRASEQQEGEEEPSSTAQVEAPAAEDGGSTGSGAPEAGNSQRPAAAEAEVAEPEPGDPGDGEQRQPPEQPAQASTTHPASNRESSWFRAAAARLCRLCSPGP